MKANRRAGDRDIAGLVYSTLYLNPICANQTINNIPVLFTILRVIYYYELEFLMQKHNGNFEVILNPQILFVSPEFVVVSNKCSCLFSEFVAVSSVLTCSAMEMIASVTESSQAKQLIPFKVELFCFHAPLIQASRQFKLSCKVFQSRPMIIDIVGHSLYKSQTRKDSAKSSLE